MGWWATGHGDDVLGDEPLDVLVGMFRFYTTMTNEKPSLQEVLDALAQILRTDGDEILSDPASLEGRTLAAGLVDGPPLLSAPEAPADKLLLGMASSLPRIARAYEDAGYGRKPRLSELLAVFTAVLHHEPERFLRDGVGPRLEAFAVGEPRSP